MAKKTDLLKRYLDAGVAFTEMSQQRAEGIVRDLVRAGKVPTDQAQQRVSDLLDRSRESTDDVLQLVRREVRSQVAKLGLVPKSEFEKVKRELADLKAASPRTVVTAPAKPAAAKAPAKKTAAKKTTATKMTAKKAAGPATKSGGTPSAD